MTLLKFLIALFITSTVLHFGWEISQMPLYETAAFSRLTSTTYTSFIEEHWIVALKDALVVVGIYLVVALAVRNSAWGKRLNGKRIITLLTVGFLWGSGIEYHAVEVAHRWAYAEAMPVIPVLNVGLAPVLQMMIVPLVGIILVRKYLSEK